MTCKNYNYQTLIKDTAFNDNITEHLKYQCKYCEQKDTCILKKQQEQVKDAMDNLVIHDIKYHIILNNLDFSIKNYHVTINYIEDEWAHDIFSMKIKDYEGHVLYQATLDSDIGTLDGDEEYIAPKTHDLEQGVLQAKIIMERYMKNEYKRFV